MVAATALVSAAESGTTNNIHIEGGYITAEAGSESTYPIGGGNGVEGVTITGGCFADANLEANTVYGVTLLQGTHLIENPDGHTGEDYPWRAVTPIALEGSGLTVQFGESAYLVDTPLDCTQQGETTYTATFESDWAEQQTKVLANISATGHSWGEPDYIWSEDGNTCTATRRCSNDSSHTETAVGQIVSERTKEPTYTEPGETTYTATFAEGWADTQTTTIADIPATGSDWYAIEYRWSADGKTCIASRTHKTEQGRVETLEVTAAGEQVKPPTCTEDGATRYTAVFDAEWTIPQSMIVEDLPATGHRWSEIAYIWSDDGHTCTATRTCMNDSTHVQTADAEVTHVQTKEPTCTEKGTTTYTASFEADWAAEQTKLIADLPATGHGETRLENMKEPTCTEEGYTGDKVCTVCGEIVEAGTTIQKIAHSFGDWTVVAQPTATEKGEQQRICTICGSVEKQEIPATSTAGDQTAAGQKDTELPQTGDKANLGLWSVLFFGSVLGLLVAIFLRRKKHKLID